MIGEEILDAPGTDELSGMAMSLAISARSTMSKPRSPASRICCPSPMSLALALVGCSALNSTTCSLTDTSGFSSVGIESRRFHKHV
ncbi:hypothetical protein ABIB25_005682 [Nakamurella sp. UYEF19]